LLIKRCNTPNPIGGPNNNANNNANPPVFMILVGLGLGLVLSPSLGPIVKWQFPIVFTLSVTLLIIPVILVLVVLIRRLGCRLCNRNTSIPIGGPSVSSPIQEKYPSDTYSLMAFYSPIKDPKIFFFGLLVFLLQFTLLLLMTLNVIVPKLRTTGEVDNPGIWWNWLGEQGEWPGGEIFPAKCSSIVRATQIVSIMAYIFVPGASLSDITGAFELFPTFITRPNPDGKLSRLRFACILRLTQGLLATLGVFVLVMTSTDVVDIILNFTAINFISEIDDSAFEQAEKGKYGQAVEDAVKKIIDEDLPHSLSKESKRKRYNYGIIFISLVLYMISVAVMVIQDVPRVWTTETVRVEFQDEERSHYSGCYTSEYYMRDGRYVYGGRSARAAIGYCSKERRWLIFDADTNWDVDPCSAYSTREEIAHSAKTDTYDIQSSIDEEWYTPFNKPIIDMYFVETDNIKETCDAFPNNGECENVLNNPDYEYDGGDCCATTCIGELCGASDDEGVALRYPNCTDPTMTALTLRIDSEMRSGESFALSLDCFTDGKRYDIFRINATDIKTNWTEPVMVVEGSTCTMNYTPIDDKATNDILPFSYSVFHGHKNNSFYLKYFETLSDQNISSTPSFEVPPPLLSRYGDFTILAFSEIVDSVDKDALSLTLGQNGFTGPIPTTLGQWTSLTYLDLHYNQLTGNIPSELGLLTSLNILELYRNDLTGTIPPEALALKANGMRLDVDDDLRD